MDNLSRKYKSYFKANSDAILQGVEADNSAKRAVITALYQKISNIGIPPGAPGDAPKDELANLTDGKLYADAWLKLISGAPVESSAYMTKKVAPILSDPTTDRAASMRIQKDASDEWEKYKGIAADTFSHDAAQITTDFETRLASLAREHRDLREALATITGPIPVDDFDVHFQKYVTTAESKIQPAAPVSQTPIATQTASSPAPEQMPVKPGPAPSATGTTDPFKTTVDDLVSKLDGQKQTLAVVKLQAQTLDDNYPILHHELSGQIEKLSSEIFWLRTILAVVGAGTFLGIVTAFNALNRAGAFNSKKTNSQGARKKQDSQEHEEPLKLVLERLYALEKELSQLQEQLIHDGKTDGDGISPEQGA